MRETLVEHIINVYEAERRFAGRIKSRFFIGSLRSQMTWVSVFEMLKERKKG